jgi:drug/metabolite transporter (DMT)-like permease
MNLPLAAILLSFLGYSILNIGQAFQKIGLSKKNDRPIAGWSIWAAATFATFISFLIVYVAISFGSVAIIGAMSGSGLASLAVFSRFAMKEKILKQEVIGILVIVAASVMIGLFSKKYIEPSIYRLGLYLFLGAGLLFYTAAGFLLRKQGLLGFVLGGLSGFLGGSSSVFQKVTTTEAGGMFFSELGFIRGFLNALENPFTVVWVLLSVISMIVLQFSYKWGKAITIIPSFTVSFIIAPVIGALVVFSESLHPIQWAGIGIMIAGSILLTAKTSRQTQGRQK